MTSLSAIAQLADPIARGERTVRATVDEALARATAADGLEAFHELDVDGARERADRLDRELAAGAAPGPLFGVPFAYKSNLCLEGAVTNCGSRLLDGWRAPYTATALERLLAAGAVPLGTTQMDEFAMGSSGENSAFAASRNPWDPERAPGGSSSGSAVAVAAGIVPFALGTDTGGSVRQPAAFCGLTGFKPSWGRVSRYGLVAFGSSFDVISPLARTALDCERVTEVLSGADERDATCAELGPLVGQPLPPAEGPAGGGGPAGVGDLVLGVPRVDIEAAEPEVRAAFEGALERWRELGATTVDVELPSADAGVATYYVLAAAEASSNLARFDGVRYGVRRDGDGTLLGMIGATREHGFGREVKRRILLGTYALSAGYHDEWYGRAQALRAALRDEYRRAFERCDAIATPTSPTVAFRLGQHVADPVAMYRADRLTVPPSLAGLPAINLPCGLSAGEPRLPIGLQLSGPRLADERVLALGRLWQRATDHHEARAPHAVGGPA